jgi:hypothetical protein
MDTHLIGWLGLNLDDLLKLLSLLGTFLAWLRVNHRKPRLEAFFTHGASHPIPESQQPIHTHALVVRNAGSYPATGVRISHAFVPPHTDIQIYPDRPKTVTPFGQNGSEILIDRLRPREQVTLSYLYPGPTLLTQFGTSVKFDDGFASFSEMQHIRVFPPWVRGIILGLMLAGFVFVLYFVLKFGLASDEGSSHRRLLIDRTRQQLRNRRKAAKTEDERSGA